MFNKSKLTLKTDLSQKTASFYIMENLFPSPNLIKIATKNRFLSKRAGIFPNL